MNNHTINLIICFIQKLKFQLWQILMWYHGDNEHLIIIKVLQNLKKTPLKHPTKSIKICKGTKDTCYTNIQYYVCKHWKNTKNYQCFSLNKPKHGNTPDVFAVNYFFTGEYSFLVSKKYSDFRRDKKIHQTSQIIMYL